MCHTSVSYLSTELQAFPWRMSASGKTAFIFEILKKKGCLHPFKLKNHIKPHAPYWQNDLIFHIKIVLSHLEWCEKVRANFRNFFNLHWKLDISCFCTQLIMPFLHFLTLNFNEIIKYKMFSSDLSWKKGQKLFSTKYVTPYPKPLCNDIHILPSLSSKLKLIYCFKKGFFSPKTC